MRVVAKGVVLKDRISLADIGRVYDLVKLAKSEKNNWAAYHYYSECVRTLTNVDKVKKKHIKLLPEIMGKAELLNKRTPSKKGAKEQLTQVLAYMGSKLGMLPNQLAEGMTPNEAPTVMDEIIRDRLENAVSLIRSYHAPKEYLKEVNKELRKLKNKRRLTKSKSDSKEKSGKMLYFNPVTALSNHFSAGH